MRGGSRQAGNHTANINWLEFIIELSLNILPKYLYIYLFKQTVLLSVIISQLTQQYNETQQNTPNKILE